MFALAAGKTEEGYDQPLHHAKVEFDERAIAYGAAALATIGLAFFQ
jgi:metal-dependent amidase/aminoacylase/carboxypeptidase family protein